MTDLDEAGHIAAEQMKYRSEQASLWNQVERQGIIKQATAICRACCVPSGDLVNLFADADGIPREGRAAGAPSLIGGPNTHSRGDREKFWAAVTELAYRWAEDHQHIVFRINVRDLRGWLRDGEERRSLLSSAYRKFKRHGFAPNQMRDLLMTILECDDWGLVTARLSRAEAMAALEEWEDTQTNDEQPKETEKAQIMTETEIQNDTDTETEERNLPTVYAPPAASAVTTSIPTTDGGSIDVNGWGTQYLPPSGGQALPRIVAGQADDARFLEGEKQLFLSAKVRVTNEKGEAENETQYIGPFGKEMVVRPIGINLPIGRSRAMMPKYNPGNTDVKPLCRSNNGILPDAEFVGKFANKCAGINPRNGKLEDMCPMSRWGAKDEDGKSAPPKCMLSYLVGVAFEWEGKWIVAETHFKSASAAAGRNLVAQLGQLHERGLTIWQHVTLKLSMEKTAKQGYTYVGVLQPDNSYTLTDEEVAVLRQAEQVWEDAQQFRKERAARAPEAKPTARKSFGEDNGDEPEENTKDIPF